MRRRRSEPGDAHSFIEDLSESVWLRTFVTRPMAGASVIPGWNPAHPVINRSLTLIVISSHYVVHATVGIPATG
jgi:hypothetical protein